MVSLYFGTELAFPLLEEVAFKEVPNNCGEVGREGGANDESKERRERRASSWFKGFGQERLFLKQSRKIRRRGLGAPVA